MTWNNGSELRPRTANDLQQRNTYSNRIIELRNTDLSYQSADGKALPEPPREKESKDQDAQSPFSDGGNEYATIETAAIAPQSWIPSDVPDYRGISSKPKSIIPGPRQPLLPPVFKVEDKILQASETAQKKQQMQYQKLADLNAPNRVFGTTTSLEPPLLKRYLPPPLSPRRPLSPAHLAEESPTKPAKIAAPSVRSDEPCEPYHTRQETAESTSWLDIIDESGGSSSSSVHSRTSLTGLRRKRIRAASGVTEAEFDAALDAAVEAAYDDGFEPDDDDDEIRPMRKPKFQSDERVFVSDVRRNVEIAKEMVREAEREAAILLAKDREKRRLQQKLAQRNSIDTDYGDEDEDEEERMLEEMTRDYIMDDSEYELQSKSALPRQSDSSGFSGRTWGSSIGSNPTTAGTSLSTVAEASVLPSLATQLQSKAMPPPAHPPPMGALPPPPSTSAIATPTQISNGLGPGQQGPLSKTNQGVRERRLSGINTKRLKIETNSKAPSSVNPSLSGNGPLPLAPLLIPTQAVTEQSKPPSASTESQQAPPNLKFSPPSATSSQTIPRKELPQSSRPASIDAAAGVVSTSLVLPKTTSADGEYNAQSRPSSPGRFATKAVGLRKNFSSSSLRNKGMVGSSSDIFEISPSTPSTATPRKAPTTAVPILPTPIGTGFIVDRLPPGGIYLFESDIHSPITPGSPNPLASNAPLPLEPCPELPLLRPFWFLRCIYQTIAHPRGAYISTKLFVPRDIWRVKSIKLKSVEEKISHCDLLSAALLKLAKVDTLDADAVLKEMQFLEHVMDQAQANLSKKLGNDVGVVGASALFKGSGTMDDGASNSEAMTLKSTNTNNKSYLSSWRKLRSKNSVGPGVIPTATGHKEGSKDGLMLESLPMTNASEPKFSKRDLSRVQYTGPNSNYMAALARLCDAVQVLGKQRHSFQNSSQRALTEHVSCRSNRPPGGRPRTEAFLANTRRPGAEHATRGRILRLLCVPVCAYGCEPDAGQIYQKRD